MTGGPDLVTPRVEATLAFECKSTLGEGPVWDSARQHLYWVDIEAPALHRFDPALGSNRAIAMPDLLGAIALTQSGGILCAFSKDLTLMSEDGQIGPVITRLQSEPATNRFNDGKCDDHGRFWIGTMSKSGVRETAALYRLDGDGSLHRMITGVGTANGLGWSPDYRTMYFTDSPRGEIYAYDFDPGIGAIANRQLFARVPPGNGRPDGLTIDAHGGVWSAHWDGWRVTRYWPNGEIDRVIEMPVPRPTSVMFGGVDLSTLFVTSARTGLSGDVLAKAPLSGSIFSIESGYTGLPIPLFDDRRISRRVTGGQDVRLR